MSLVRQANGELEIVTAPAGWFSREAQEARKGTAVPAGTCCDGCMEPATIYSRWDASETCPSCEAERDAAKGVTCDYCGYPAAVVKSGPRKGEVIKDKYNAVVCYGCKAGKQPYMFGY